MNYAKLWKLNEVKRTLYAGTNRVKRNGDVSICELNTQSHRHIID